jgi:hypothetical protein
VSIKARSILFRPQALIDTRPKPPANTQRNSIDKDGESAGSIEIFANNFEIDENSFDAPLLLMNGDDGLGTGRDEECIYHDGGHRKYLNYNRDLSPIIHSYPFVVCVKDATGKVLLGQETDRHVFDEPPERLPTGGGGDGGDLSTNIADLQMAEMHSIKGGVPGRPLPCKRLNSCGPHDPDCSLSAELIILDRPYGAAVDLMSRRQRAITITPIGKRGRDGRLMKAADYNWLDTQIAEEVLKSISRWDPEEQKAISGIYAATIKACFEDSKDEFGLFLFASSICTEQREIFQVLLQKFTEISNNSIEVEGLAISE